MVVTGRLVALALVAAVAVTVGWPAWPGVVVASCTVFALALLDVLLVAQAMDVVLARPDRTVIRLGETTQNSLQVTNAGHRRLRGRVWTDWPESTRPRYRSHQLSLPPNTTTTLSTTLTPTHRGDRHAGPVTLRLLGPLGLAGRQTRRAVPAVIRALPAFHSRRLVAEKVRLLHHLDGRNIATLRGEGTEFDSFREYVPGDDVRAIDWRATARAQDVMVRTWRPERHRHITVVLDTGRFSAGRIGQQTRLDVMIEAALLVGTLAAAAGDAVDLLAYDRQIRAELRGGAGRPGGSKGLPPRLLHALSDVVPTLVDTDTTGLVRTVVGRVHRRSLILWFTSLDNPAARVLLPPVLPTLTARHRVVIVSVTDPAIAAAKSKLGDIDQVCRAAAAETRHHESDLLAESLRRMGVEVVTGGPDTLPNALVDSYLRRKRSGPW